VPLADTGSSDSEPDFIINHLNDNHYSPVRSSDPDSDGPAAPTTPQDSLENHVPDARPQHPAAPGGEGAEVDGDDDDDDDDNDDAAAAADDDDDGGHHAMEEAGEDVENGGGARDGEFPSEGAGDSGGLSPELRPQRYPSPSSLKKQILNDCMEVNNQLRALITKEIRKPGRRRSPPPTHTVWSLVI